MASFLTGGLAIGSCTVSVLLASTLPVSAFVEPNLQGVDALKLVVEDFENAATAQCGPGITESNVRRLIEHMLLSERIPIHEEAPVRFYVNLSFVATDKSSIAVNTYVSLFEAVDTVDRANPITTVGVTWWDSSLGLYGNQICAKNVVETIQGYVMDVINAWKKARIQPQ